MSFEHFRLTEMSRQANGIETTHRNKILSGFLRGLLSFLVPLCQLFPSFNQFSSRIFLEAEEHARFSFPLLELCREDHSALSGS